MREGKGSILASPALGKIHSNFSSSTPFSLKPKTSKLKTELRKTNGNH